VLVGFLGGSKAKESGRGKRLVLLFVTDLHGSEFTFRKLLRALEVWAPDVLMVGGDAGGKGLYPVLRTGDRYRLQWMEKEYELSADEVEEYETKAIRLGFYPFRAEADEIQAMRDDPELAQRVFERHMVARWADWLDRLEARCAELRIPAFVIAGNDDPWSMDEPLLVEREWVRAADGKVLPLQEAYWVVATGLANITPWSCPRDIPEEELERRLEELANQIPDFTNVIANIHVPPYGSTLDSAVKLDTSVSPPRPIAGQQASVGSTAVDKFIRSHQPLLALVGHIHESPGAVKIGRTHVINPGSEYAEEVLRGVLVTVEPGKVVGHQFVNG
jgi:Icc-related predicted phosphoesterase